MLALKKEMEYRTVNIEMLKEENTAFYERWESSLRDLFGKARETHELWFAFSLNPEFRGCQDPGWSTADDAMVAFDEYLQFVNEKPITSLKARVALGFYSHLSEASGFYEIPKNMLRVAEGKPYVLWPFRDLVEKHRVTGDVIAPNANKVLKDLAGHAKSLGFHNLAMCFRDAFDPDLRNGYAHADYVIWSDGIRLRKRNGGHPRKVSWDEFGCRFERGINFFHLLREIVSEYVASYREPKTIKASLDGGPEMCWTIHADPDKHAFSISGGLG